jgi:hypothetical protein
MEGRYPALPPGIVNQVMAVQSGISERAKLESNMDYFAFSLNMLYADLFRAGIEELKLDSVIIKLKTDTSKINSVRLFPVYLAAGDVNGADSAFSVIKNISTDTTSYELTMQGINLQMLKDTLTPAEIEKYTLATVEMFTLNSPMQSFKAKALMKSARGKKYKREPYSKENFNNRSSIESAQNIQSTSDLDLIAFPNPANDYININASIEGQFDVAIYNQYGVMLVFQTMEDKQGLIDIRKLENGVYMLLVRQTNNIIATKKITVIK